MGDCDDSYDFSDLTNMIEALWEGYGFVSGNRFTPEMERGAMSFSHRYIGVPLLSFLGRWKYKVRITDFHCGLRGFDTASAQIASFMALILAICYLVFYKKTSLK